MWKVQYLKMEDSCRRLTFMHNGGISGFSQIRRQMRAALRDDVEANILGNS